MDKLQLELPILLPDVDDERDACVKRLINTLEERHGVKRAHVKSGDPALLCIHYEPDVLPLSRLRQQTQRLGAELTGRYGHVTWQVAGFTNQRRARKVAEKLCKAPGVLDCDANASGVFHFEFDRNQTSEAQLRAVLKDSGLRIVDEHAGDIGEKDHEHHHHGLAIFGERTELIFSILCGVFLAAGFGLSFAEAIPSWLTLTLYGASYFFGGFFLVGEVLGALRRGRFDIDFLMLVAAAGAGVLGEWAEGALLLFLFSLGHALEHYAMGRARRAIESLTDLAPNVATVRRNGSEIEVPVEELQVGDIVIVRTHERLPVDGIVVKGESDVNQAPVTGESVPVDKYAVEDVDAARAKWETLGAAHRVFAGTINGAGSLEVMVTRRAGDSTIARLVQMVTEAEAQQSPTQRFAERFERIFVPSVLGFVFLLLFAWVVIDEPFSASFYRAMAVVVAASPCALAIATPSAVLSAVARAGRGGVLVKGGRPLEHLGALEAIAFDKTGTLTEGNPSVTDVVPGEGIAEKDLIETAVAVEKLSDHPLAEAVVRYGKMQFDGEMLAEATDLKSITGRGVRAKVDGEDVYLGKDDLFGEIEGPPLPDALAQTVQGLEEAGRTTMVLRRNGRYLGVIGLMDTPRASARDTLLRLRALGIRHMVMISGDNQQVAGAVAQQIGLDEARGDLMPDDKVAVIRELSRNGLVAMVGDGVNDAPAMANATIGIAMGAAGSDVALETADIALMGDDLSRLPFAVGLSRKAGRIIKQNLWISLGMVAFLIPATLLGLSLGPAVALHEGSTLVVVLNALRLLGYKGMD